MAVYSEIQMPRFKEEDLPGTTKKLYNVVRELQEMLQFVLTNLDGDNIEGYEEIFNRLEGADGAISILKQTADEIMMQVRKNSDQISELDIRADGITARVQDNEQGIAELEITAAGISQRVADTEGNLSSLQQTADGLTSRVSSAEGNISTLQQTAGGLTSRVSSAEGNISTLQQTAGGLTSRVASAEGSISTLRQTANGLSSTVSDLSGKYTSIKQTVDSIDLTGVVTFTDLSRSGRTEINADNITTGSIDCSAVTIANDYGELTMARGSTGVLGTRGAKLSGPVATGGFCNYFIATNAAARMTGEDMFGGNNFYVSKDDIHADISIDVGSDERIKNSIEYDVAERYGAFYRALKPARYHMNDSRSDRTHTGFIAQQMRDALLGAGLTRLDLAALVQEDYDAEAEDGGGGRYAIRYSELIALNTAMVQALMNRVDTLEQRLAAAEESV